MTVQEFLSKLDGVRENGSGFEALCPAHNDQEPSLSIREGDDGRLLVRCFAGCETKAVVEAVGLSMSDLYAHNACRGGGGANLPPDNRSTGQRSEGVTLEAYSEYTAIGVEFLKSLGLRQITYVGEHAVRMPYMDASGEETLLSRFRVSLNGKPKVKTKSGDKHRLYGLWRLDEGRKSGYCWLVEGESDCQTLWYHGEPAVGIPGAGGWKPQWASDLEGIDRLYFVVEDRAGESCWETLAATPEIRERLYRVELREVKDVSGLHKQDPDGFKKRLSDVRESARAWLDIAETEAQEQAREAWTACRELAESPDILVEFVADLERVGLVGEKRNAKLLYLILTSRMLEEIVSAVVKGPSSAGKNFLVKRVTEFFPESACWACSGMSERALFYTEESLSHRHIVLSESTGVGGAFQDYIIRTLLSEDFLEYEFVEKTPDGLRPRRLRKEGPTGFITTTTRGSLFQENETRLLSLTVTDTTDQTRLILRAIAEDRREVPDLGRWRALQVWLEGSERRVYVPFAGDLAEKTSDAAVRLRRDFSAILSLVRSHALLHRATRETDREGRIVATLQDYAAVRELVADLISDGVQAAVPPPVRETVEAVSQLAEESDGGGGDEDPLFDAPKPVTNQSIADRLGIDKAAASRRVKVACERGYLKNLEDHKGKPARLIVGEAMPEDKEILPPREELVEDVEASEGC